MMPSGMLRRVALVRNDVSEELRTSFIRVTRICEIGITLALTLLFHFPHIDNRITEGQIVDILKDAF
jgi:DNA-binding TFAR19-related protein (PDSD5 family)